MLKIDPKHLLLELISFKTVFFILIIRFFWTLFRHRNIFRFARNQNGPSYPTFQQIWFVLQKDTFAIFSNLNRLYGLPCNLWIGLKYTYFTIEPSEVKTILTSPHTLERASYYDDVLFKMYHDSVFSQTYLNWKISRKFINRHFSKSLFDYFVTNIYRYGREFGKNADKDLDSFGGISRHIMQLNFSTFSENILGVNTDAVSSKAATCIYRIHHEILKRKSSRIFSFDMWKKYSKSGQKFDQNWNEFLEVVDQIVELYKKNNVDQHEYTNGSKSEGLIGAFLNDKGKLFPETEIRQQLSFLITAAMETTSNTLAYTFILLGMHKHIQEKVYEEVLNTVGLERDILKDDLPNLKYIEMVLLETLRLFPVVPCVGRRTTADLDLGTKILPKGCDAVLPVYLIHNNEKYWPNSKKFIPERFLPENMKHFEPGTYLPFLIGPKDCSGKAYGLAFMKVFLATVMRHYKFSSNHKSIEELSNLQAYMSMVPATQVDIQVLPRS